MADRAFVHIGDSLTNALISGDFAAYSALMHLPLKIIPRGEAAYSLLDQDGLRQDFERYYATIRAQGVTDIYRQILDFQDLPPDRATMRVLTHILVRDHRIVDPFETTFLLVRTPEDWKIGCIESSEGHIKWTLGRATILQSGKFSETGSD